MPLRFAASRYYFIDWINSADINKKAYKCGLPDRRAPMFRTLFSNGSPKEPPGGQEAPELALLVELVRHSRSQPAEEMVPMAGVPGFERFLPCLLSLCTTFSRTFV